MAYNGLTIETAEYTADANIATASLLTLNTPLLPLLTQAFYCTARRASNDELAGVTITYGTPVEPCIYDQFHQ